MSMLAREGFVEPVLMVWMMHYYRMKKVIIYHYIYIYVCNICSHIHADRSDDILEMPHLPHSIFEPKCASRISTGHADISHFFPVHSRRKPPCWSNLSEKLPVVHHHICWDKKTNIKPFQTFERDCPKTIWAILDVLNTLAFHCFHILGEKHIFPMTFLRWAPSSQRGPLHNGIGQDVRMLRDICCLAMGWTKKPMLKMWDI